MIATLHFIASRIAHLKFITLFTPPLMRARQLFILYSGITGVSSFRHVKYLPVLTPREITMHHGHIYAANTHLPHYRLRQSRYLQLCY
jgi:hypothetical protein